MIINNEYTSKNTLPRDNGPIQFLVLHYTEVPLATTLGIFTNNHELALADADYFVGTDIDLAALCKNSVSSHYVNSEMGDIYQLVAEEDAARHAGKSYWQGQRELNKQSIGIEHVNLGFNWSKKFPEERGVKVQGSDKIWCPFAEPQIAATIELCNEIIKRHDIMPYNIVAHSDIACDRKIDPGPLFPWKRLAAAGIGIWYDITESTFHANNMPESPVAWVQNKLAEFGYDCPQTKEQDAMTTTVLKAFQMHFRQDNIDGEIDLESIQILDSLCKRKLKLENLEEHRLKALPYPSPIL